MTRMHLLKEARMYYFVIPACSWRESSCFDDWIPAKDTPE